MPWRRGAYELPKSAIRDLLKLATLRPNDVFADLGSGTGPVVVESVQRTDVGRAIGVESETESREAARSGANEALTHEQLKRVDFWIGDVYSESFDYRDVNVVYNSLQEDEEEVSFYRRRFSKHLRVIKKDLPLVGYKPSAAVRSGRVWLFRTDFPPTRIRSRSEWAALTFGVPTASIEDVCTHYREVLSRRGIIRKEIDIALNELEHLIITRF